MQNAQRLTGKVAVVTGGARGIGEATAIALAQAGTDVGVLDLDADDAPQVQPAMPPATGGSDADLGGAVAPP